MAKNIHEIRDPIHVFIKLDSQERTVLDSRPFQRLRCIHQLAMTYLLYPGATHRRFEHSLGVMELAGRVFDVVTQPDNLTDIIREMFPQTMDRDKRNYWRRALRMAALCHDIGHLPFSHAAEKDLLPDGWDHERLTRELILSPALKAIWSELEPPINPEHIIKLAVGPKKASDLKFSDWEILLSEMIVGDAFGVDRMDYLLRDSLHAGVAYGKFDHFRLIDTLRILPPPASGDEKEQSTEPCIGVEAGGLQSAESLLLARYFMFSQVYFHPVRRVYDLHLKDFLKEWLNEGCYPTDLDQFLSITDSEVTSALRLACDDPLQPGYEHAKRIIHRKHFKVLYEGLLRDIEASQGASVAEIIATAAESEFGKGRVKFDSNPPRGGTADFPVLERDGAVVSSLSKSQVLRQLPAAAFDYVFIDPELVDAGKKWFQANKPSLLQKGKGEEQ